MDSKYIFDKDLHLTFDVRIIMRQKRFIFGCIDHFYSHGQRLYKFFGTNGSFNIRKLFNRHRIFTVHQHGCRFTVLYTKLAAVMSCENHR